MFLWLAFWTKSEDALEEVDTPEVAKTVLVGVPNTWAKKTGVMEINIPYLL